MSQEQNPMDKIQNNPKTDSTSQVEEKLNIEAEIAKIHAKLEQLVDAEMAKITADTINYSDLGCDLEEADLTKILVVNGAYTNSMTLEDKTIILVATTNQKDSEKTSHE